MIECLDDSANQFVYRFPVKNQEIKMGAQLIVAPDQVAILVSEGTVADFFQPGHYELAIKNMPRLTQLKAWPYGFQSPFKAEVYFIHTKKIMNQHWKTTTPIQMYHPAFQWVNVHANGTFSYHVSDPVLFLNTILGSTAVVSAETILEPLQTHVLEAFLDALNDTKTAYLALAAVTEPIHQLIEIALQEKFKSYGLILDTFTIQISKEVQENLVEMSTPATSKAILGNLMQQVLNQPQQQLVADQQPLLEQSATKSCVYCQTINPFDASYCAKCGRKQL